LCSFATESSPRFCCTLALTPAFSVAAIESPRYDALRYGGLQSFCYATPVKQPWLRFSFCCDLERPSALNAVAMIVSVGLCPDWEDWVPGDRTANATEAMDAAEQWLDIPQVRRTH